MRKVPTSSTIRKRANYYAYRAGFTYHPQSDGTIALFDMRMNYYVFRGSPEHAARFIHDQLYIKSRQNFESSPPRM